MKKNIQNNYERNIEVVVSALITKGNKILLVKSRKWKDDKYSTPGGHVENGETILEAAKREGEEETGLKLKPLFCINAGELINSQDFHRKAHLVYFHVVCKALGDDVKLDKNELKDFIWVPAKDALKLPNLRELYRTTIKNYVLGTKINFSSAIF